VDGLVYGQRRFFPQMLDWVAEQVETLVAVEGVRPGEIAILGPRMTGAVRFALAERLGSRQIRTRAHHPSRPLRDEPAVQCAFTLSALAHPQWGLPLSRFDVAYALMQAIAGMDLVRAQFLTDIVYRVREGAPFLSTFEQIHAQAQERVTYALGDLYEGLRGWLVDYGQEFEEGDQTHRGDTNHQYDLFLGRLFEEVLTQPGYGFPPSSEAAEVMSNLIESARNFRLALRGILEPSGAPLGKEYVLTVQEGVLPAQFLPGWRDWPEDSILLASANTFLMMDRPVAVQFWLDAGSRSWLERPGQPLANPHVLSRHWPRNQVWTDEEEVQAGLDRLYRLAVGLVRRCRTRIYLAGAQLSEQGYEQRGPLIRILSRFTHDAS
jgi:hypothetical protein